MDVKGDPLPARSGLILAPLRRGKAAGDRIALALAVPTIKPGGQVNGKLLNDYADRRRASFGFTEDSGTGPGWHCTPAGLIVKGGQRHCGKATCRFCWCWRVGEMLNRLHARRQASEAAGVPCSFRFARADLPRCLDEYEVTLNEVKNASRRKLKAEVDYRKAGTPAGAWSGILLLPHPRDLANPPTTPTGRLSEGVLSLFSVRAFEGPAARGVMQARPDRRELDVPGELLDEHLKANSPLVDFFAPVHDPAGLPAAESKAIRVFWAKAKRITAYGTLREKKRSDPINENGKADADAQFDEGGSDAGDEGEPPVEQVSKRPPPMRPLGESLPDQPG